MTMIIFYLAVVGVFVAAFISAADPSVDQVDDAEEEFYQPEGDWRPVPGASDEIEPDEVYLVSGTYEIPDGQLTINPDGSFVGERVEVNDYDGAAPPTTDRTAISGQIAENGKISGTFTGTDTYATITGDEVQYEVEQVNGSISGQIAEGGTWSVNWDGPEPGTQSGQFPSGDVSNLLAGILLGAGNGGGPS